MHTPLHTAVAQPELKPPFYTLGRLLNATFICQGGSMMPTSWNYCETYIKHYVETQNPYLRIHCISVVIVGQVKTFIETSFLNTVSV